jgi:hypothetical protein
MPAHVRDRTKPCEVADGQTLGIPKPKVLVGMPTHDAPWQLYSLVRSPSTRRSPFSAPGVSSPRPRRRDPRFVRRVAQRESPRLLPTS